MTSAHNLTQGIGLLDRTGGGGLQPARSFSSALEGCVAKATRRLKPALHNDLVTTIANASSFVIT
jgi:hypothetical protein